jgi:hypothetical protein
MVNHCSPEVHKAGLLSEQSPGSAIGTVLTSLHEKWRSKSFSDPMTRKYLENVQYMAMYMSSISHNVQQHHRPMLTPVH